MKNILSVLTGIILSLNVLMSEVRPIRDDVGYFWERENLQKLIQYIEAAGKPLNSSPKLIGGISPHDDYLYAGELYYPLFKNISAREVVVFGVTHGTVRNSFGDPQNTLILDSHSSWQAMDGKIRISKLREWLKDKLKGEIIVNNGAHRVEHSIEAALPFLQYFNPDIALTPIMVTAMPWERMEVLTTRVANAITDYMDENNLRLGEDIFFLVSADANHYGEDFENSPFGSDARAHQLGTALDKNIIRAYLTGAITASKCHGLTKGLWGTTYRDHSDTLWCGRYSIPFGLVTLVKVTAKVHGSRHLIGSLFGYSDTYSRGVIPLKKTGHGITAPFSLKHWVGFFSAGYYLE
jgi:AmmeMemoRadiSam system protein B